LANTGEVEKGQEAQQKKDRKSSPQHAVAEGKDCRSQDSCQEETTCNDDPPPRIV
jgi:hypothetical protein